MKKTFLAGLAACVFAAGCSNSEPIAETIDNNSLPGASPTPTEPATPVLLSGSVNDQGRKDFTTVGANIAVEFELDEHYFAPTFVKVLPNSDVTYSLQNGGDVEHSFTIDSLQIDQKVTPGGRFEGQLKLPESGIIEFYCVFHVQSGMRGAFYFEEGGIAPAVSPSVQPSPTPTADVASTSTGASRSAAGPRRTSTGTRSTGAARPATGSTGAARPAGASQPNVNQSGDLVVPDLNLGEPQKGASSLDSPPASAATLPKAGTGAQAATSSSSDRSSGAPSGAKGPDAPAGADGGKGLGGSDGESSDPAT